MEEKKRFEAWDCLDFGFRPKKKKRVKKKKEFDLKNPSTITKSVLVCQVMSLDFEWIQRSHWTWLNKNIINLLV